MSDRAYTLASYRVKEGQERAFVSGWKALSEVFSALPDPPLWGTLIRHETDRTLFFSFGPWQSPEHVRAMRDSPVAMEAFRRLGEFCVEISPGNYEEVIHVDVQGTGRTGT